MKDFSITAVLRILLLLLVLAWCFMILRPFLIVIVWAIIIGVALYPLYKRFLGKNPDKGKKAKSIVFALGAALVFILPLYFVFDSVVDSAKVVVDQMQNDNIQIPLPDEKVKEWPLVGKQLYTEWYALSENFQQYAEDNREFILDAASQIISGLTGFLSTIAIFIVSFLISIILMYYAENGYQAAMKFYKKLMGEHGDEMVYMSRDTIRSVVKGILLVAVIQAAFAFLGFKVMGIPAAGIFTLLVLIFAIVQLPPILVMIPAIIIAFSMASPTSAVIFTIYCIIVAGSDSFLKPLLLGKGLRTPMIVILVGTIGGLLLHGIIGLFVGPVVLALMYQLYLYWVDVDEYVAKNPEISDHNTQDQKD